MQKRRQRSRIKNKAFFFFFEAKILIMVRIPCVGSIAINEKEFILFNEFIMMY